MACSIEKCVLWIRTKFLMTKLYVCRVITLYVQWPTAPSWQVNLGTGKTYEFVDDYSFPSFTKVLNLSLRSLLTFGESFDEVNLSIKRGFLQKSFGVSCLRVLRSTNLKKKLENFLSIKGGRRKQTISDSIKTTKNHKSYKCTREE